MQKKTQNIIFNKFISSIIAGLLIACGGYAYLICSTKLTSNGNLYGSFLFSLGLFTILCYQFDLFTGKVCYMLFENKKYNLLLIIILLGNFIGGIIAGYLLRITSSNLLLEYSETIVQNKINNNYLQTFILACFCGIMIFLAVDIYKTNEHKIAKYLGIIFCVMVFILCGFEHCVANVFYFAISNTWSFDVLISLMFMILGNTIGGSIIPLGKFLVQKTKQSNEENK